MYHIFQERGRDNTRTPMIVEDTNDCELLFSNYDDFNYISKLQLQPYESVVLYKK